ncbi:MAG: hypothetical protein K2R93_21765 [Gemmatimonadaceae bacterium]|nr:hypothetical protein [Gemmatimonadaceae bacterium]
MTRRLLANLTLMALIVSCLVQVGAQLFAVSMIARVLQSAPPRSFAILEGPYHYDSSAFWDVVPALTGGLFLLALIANWRTDRRTLLGGAFALFLLAGVAAGTFVEPMFDRLVAGGYRDVVDPALQAQAATWYAWDRAIWVLGLAAGILLLAALTRPVIHRAT